MAPQELPSLGKVFNKESATTPHWRSSQTMVVKTGHGIIAAESRARGISGAEDVE